MVAAAANDPGERGGSRAARCLLAPPSCGAASNTPRAARAPHLVRRRCACRSRSPAPLSPPAAGATHHCGEGVAPPLDGCAFDPLCVEYEKRDITATNGGAIDFLAAEPARFAIAIPKCRYWQLDHWRVQPSPGDPTIVGWDGDYWFNKRNSTGAAELMNFTIGGQSAGRLRRPAHLDELRALRLRRRRPHHRTRRRAPGAGLRRAPPVARGRQPRAPSPPRPPAHRPPRAP